MDKVAIITGGAGGIGLASAIELARRGVRVAVIDEAADIVDPRLAALVDDGRALLITQSFEDVPALQRAVDEVRTVFGRIDVLVNAATDAGPDGLWDVAEDAWQRCIRVNMKLPFFALQACVPHMRAVGGGRVVNLSSVLSAVTDGHHRMVMGLAKAGLNSMTRQWSVDLSPDNIQANSLWVGDDEPDRLPSPEDVAAFVAFLALDATEQLNGAQIPVDGGAAALRQGRMLTPA